MALQAVRVMALRNIDQPEAVLFDCDGVLVDTEKDGHRVSFNAAFKMKGEHTSKRGLPLLGPSLLSTPLTSYLTAAEFR